MELDDDGAREWNEKAEDWRPDSKSLTCILSAWMWLQLHPDNGPTNRLFHSLEGIMDYAQTRRYHL